MSEQKYGLKLKPLQMLRVTKRLLWMIYIFSKIPRFTTVLMYLLRPFYEPTKETWLNRKLRYGLLTFGAGLLPPKELKAYGFGAKAVINNINDVEKAIKNGEPIVWIEWILNAEIVEAFGVTSFCTAVLNIFSNVHSMAAPGQLIEACEMEGLPVEYCSAMKLDMGSYLLKQIPVPSVAIAGSHPCDTNVSINQAFEYLTNVPTFIMDIPYWKDDNAYEYINEVMWNLVYFLKDNLKKEADWDKLRGMMERLNKFNFYLREICEMNRAIPAPNTMINLNFAWVVREVAVRDPQAVKMAKMLYESVKKNYEKGKGVIKKEKIRVLLWFPPIGFFTYIFKWMEHEFGAVIVSDFIGHVSTIEVDTSSNESMIRDLAKTQMMLAMGRQCHGPIEFITDEMVKLMDDYTVDCMIFSGHRGCKHGWGGIKIIQDACKKKDMPVLYLDIDIMDPRYLDEQGVKDEVRKFFKAHGWA